VEAKKSNRFGLSKAVLFFGQAPKVISAIDTLVEKSTRSNFQLSVSNRQAPKVMSAIDTLGERNSRSNIPFAHFSEQASGAVSAIDTFAEKIHTKQFSLMF
jgi:hypothetical protein